MGRNHIGGANTKHVDARPSRPAQTSLKAPSLRGTFDARHRPGRPKLKAPLTMTKFKGWSLPWLRLYVHMHVQARAMGSQAREATGPCDPSWSQLDPHYTSGLATPETQSLFLEIHPPSRPGQGSHPEFTPLAHDPHPSLSGEGGFWERKKSKAQNTLVSLSQNGERTLFETTMA